MADFEIFYPLSENRFFVFLDKNRATCIYIILNRKRVGHVLNTKVIHPGEDMNCVFSMLYLPQTFSFHGIPGGSLEKKKRKKKLVNWVTAMKVKIICVTIWGFHSYFWLPRQAQTFTFVHRQKHVPGHQLLK